MRGYHSLDMRWHRAKLNVVRNRIMIIWSFVLAAYVFSFVLGFIILGRINKAIIRIEENQKGNNCILLIKPSERTTKNIGECIDTNRSDNNKFQFNPPKSTPTPASSNSTVAPPPKLAPVPKITVEKPQPPPAPVVKTNVEEVTQTVCTSLRPIEHRIDPLTQLPEFRCTGDTLWQVQ